MAKSIRKIAQHIGGSKGNLFAERLRSGGVGRPMVVPIEIGKSCHKALIADCSGNILKEPFEFHSSQEGIRFLQAGGLVSMAGDIVWRKDQRKVRVTFLGHDAYLPEAPFIFALVSGAPLFVFFAFRISKNNYHFTLSDPLPIRAACRKDRAAAISQAAQQYADLLEKALRKYPFEWYHFDRFIH